MVPFGNDVWLGVDLPLVFDASGVATVKDDIFGLWLLQDVYTMLATGGSALYPPPLFGADQITDFKKLNIYFDTGSNDDFDPLDDVVGFGIIAQHEKFAELLGQLNITHTSATYTGAHTDVVYTRIEAAFWAFNIAIRD